MNLFGFLKKKDAAFYIEGGETAFGAGDLDDAEKLFSRALELAEEKKEYASIGITMLRLGEIAEKQDKIVVAEKFFSAAFRHYQDLEEYEEAARCLVRLGIVCFKQHRLEESTQIFGTAEKYFHDDDPNHPGVAESLTWLAKSCMAGKYFPMAEKHARTAISAIQTRNGSDDEALGELWKLAGECCAAQDKNAEADAAFKSALTIYDKHGANAKQLELCSCLHAYGRWLKRQNKKDDAAEMMQRAWRICEEFPGYLEEGELAAELAQLG